MTFERYVERHGSFARFDLVIHNPPFVLAEAHVELAASILAPGGCVATLERAPWFLEGDKRDDFRARLPMDLLVVGRWSFTGEALAWLDDPSILALATEKEHMETAKDAARALVTTCDDALRSRVCKRLRACDNIPHAWGFHGAGRGGRFEVLTSAQRRALKARS